MDRIVLLSTASEHSGIFVLFIVVFGTISLVNAMIKVSILYASDIEVERKYLYIPYYIIFYFLLAVIGYFIILNVEFIQQMLDGIISTLFFILFVGAIETIASRFIAFKNQPTRDYVNYSVGSFITQFVILIIIVLLTT